MKSAIFAALMVARVPGCVATSQDYAAAGPYPDNFRDIVAPKRGWLNSSNADITCVKIKLADLSGSRGA